MVQRLHDNRITALYCRLSRDDGYADDSCSIDSQKSMLREYAINEGFDRCEFFVDDGFSGTNFDRPDFSRMIDMIEHNMVGTLVVKDLSRLGREYLRTGYYTEIIFPMHDVRFIAINDGVDSANGENEFAPFKNLLNEMYAKDISRKIKSSIRTRTKRGEYVNGKPPYGYMRDPDNRNHLIPDRNTSGQCNPWRNMRMLPNPAVMIHGSPCVDNRILPNPAPDIDDRPSHHLHAFLQNRPLGYHGRWVNNLTEMKSLCLEFLIYIPS